MITTEERQIREAFIDGYLSAQDHGGDKSAAQAWRDENQTDGRDPAEPPRPFGYPGWRDDLWLVVDGGARDQAHLGTVIFRLRRALALAEMTARLAT